MRIALLDNFCWPDPVYDRVKTPDGRHKLAQLVRAARGCHDTAVAYGTPFISGKDSMKNDYKIGEHKVSVRPTILVSAIGMVPDIRNCVSSDFKCPGDSVYLLGMTRRELGQSLYCRMYGGISGSVPQVDWDANLKLYREYYELAMKGLLASGHDLSEGGLAVAAAEMAFAGSLGCDIDLASVTTQGDLGDAARLFSEGDVPEALCDDCEYFDADENWCSIRETETRFDNNACRYFEAKEDTVTTPAADATARSLGAEECAECR